MGHQKHISETPATHFLRQHAISFSEHPYNYEENGGTSVSSRELGVDEHSVVKTLVMQNDAGKPLIVLMHGDCTVSTKNLARQIGCKSVTPCSPDVAQRHSGYQIGGTSPFGTKKGLADLCGKGNSVVTRYLYQWRSTWFFSRHSSAGINYDVTRNTG